MRYPLDSDIEYAFETAYDLNGAEGWRGIKYHLTELTLLRRLEEALKVEHNHPAWGVTGKACWQCHHNEPCSIASAVKYGVEYAQSNLNLFREDGIKKFEG